MYDEEEKTEVSDRLALSPSTLSLCTVILDTAVLASHCDDRDGTITPV